MFSSNYYCVDVYQLILDRGTIGALLYANEIENKNIRLASKIDKAVNYINRISQVPTFSPVEVPSMPAQIPSQIPQEHTMGPGTKQILDSRAYPQGNKNLDYVGRLTQEGSDIYAGSKFLKYLKLISSQKVDELLLKANTDKLAAQKLADLIQRAPSESRLGDLFGNANNLLKDSNLMTKEKLIEKVQNVLGKSNPSLEQEILAYAAHGQGSFFNKATSVLKNKYLGAPAESSLIKSLNLSDKAKNLIKGANPQDWENILNTNGLSAEAYEVANTLQDTNKLADVIKSGESTGPVVSVLQGVVDAGGPFAGIFEKILGFAKNPLFGKFLMGVGTAFQAYDVWKDIQQYGYDAQTICKIAGAISGVCSFIPPLAPFAIPINIALGFGCSFVPRDSSKASDQISSKDITDRAQNINASNLDSNDLSKLQTIANEASDDVDFQNSISQALKNKSFKNLLDVAALAYKYLHEDKSAIPGVNKQTPQSNTDSKPATVSFNYRKYRLAFG